MTVTLILSFLCIMLLLVSGILLMRNKAKNEEIKKSVLEFDELRMQSQINSFVNTAVLEIGNIIRKSGKEEAELSRNLLFAVAPMVEAGYGCITLINQENGLLETVAVYAFDKTDIRERSIKPGETLTGEAFYSDKPSVTKNLPEKFIKINSGTGNTAALELMLVPLVFNDSRVGVAEFAGYKPFRDEHLEIAGAFGESLAATLISIRAETRTRHLLESSESISSKLKANETTLEQKVAELQEAQRQANETKRNSDRRIQENITSQQQLMEKIIKKFEVQEQKLKERISALEEENDRLKSSE